MTNAEAKHIVDVAFGVPQAVRRAGEDRTYHEEEIREAKEMAIKALEQQTCEDAVSREAVLDIFADNADATRPYSTAWEKIRDLPPVNPQPNAINKIREIVDEWQLDTWTDNLSYECMVKIAELVEPQESEDKCSNCAKSWTDNCPRNKCWDNDYSEFIKESEVSE